jgi:hypothetical protein
MKPQIRTKNPTYTTKNNGLAYISRSITNWNIDFKNKTTTPLVEEIAFIEENIDVSLPVVVDGVVTEDFETINQTKRVNIEVISHYTSDPLSFEEAGILFTSLNDNINIDENFMEEITRIMQSAILSDTKNFTSLRYNVSAEDWILDTI